MELACFSETEKQKKLSAPCGQPKPERRRVGLSWVCSVQFSQVQTNQIKTTWQEGASFQKLRSLYLLVEGNICPSKMCFLFVHLLFSSLTSFLCSPSRFYCLFPKTHTPTPASLTGVKKRAIAFGSLQWLAHGSPAKLSSGQSWSKIKGKTMLLDHPPPYLL